jgi:hypothetical protein
VAQDTAPGQRPGTAPAPVAWGSGPGQRPRTFPRAGWVGVSSCPKARGHSSPVAPGLPPLPGGPGCPRARRPEVIPCRWLRASRASGPEFPLPGGAESALPPVARGCPLTADRSVSSAPMARGFPLAGWLRVSPSPATVPGGREISTPIVRAAQEVSTSNFKILWPSTSHPQLTPSCPPRQAFLHRVLHSPVHRRRAGRRPRGTPARQAP